MEEPVRYQRPEVSRQRARAIYGFMLLMHFMLAIDMTSVAIALPVGSVRQGAIGGTLQSCTSWYAYNGGGAILTVPSDDSKVHECQQDSRLQHGHRLLVERNHLSATHRRDIACDRP